MIKMVIKESMKLVLIFLAGISLSWAGSAAKYFDFSLQKEIDTQRNNACMVECMSDGNGYNYCEEICS